MQPEHRADDAAPFAGAPPSSPTMPSLRHQPPTTVPADPPPPSPPTLRRRLRSYPDAVVSAGVEEADAGGAGGAGGTVRVCVQTPHADLGAGGRHEWRVPAGRRVGALKDELADGRAGLGEWERHGMRVVWQGRIVGDDETVGAIVGDKGDVVHTFHLVARPIAAPQTTAPAPTSAPAQAASASAPPSLEATALLDSVHYFLFLARHHLCVFLGAPPLRWDETAPPPAVSMELAQDAVVSVVRGLAGRDAGRTEAWEGWERAFESARVVDRELAEGELRDAWATATARKWEDAGGQVTVEVDFVAYMLHVPPLAALDDEQLAHLVVYLRIVALLPHVSLALERALAPRPQLPAPTPTTAVPATRRRTRGAPAAAHPAAVPFAAVSHAFFSAMRLCALIWMLTRHMAWHDARFWVMAAMSGAWWLYDALQSVARERRAARAAARQARARARGDGAQGEGEGEGGGPDAALPAAGTHDAAQPPRRAHRAGAGLDAYTAHFHLDLDSEQLRLPPGAAHRLAAGTEDGAPRLEPPAWRAPPRWATQCLLPIYLWVITLVPEFEASRARAIRRRERAMRVIAGELQVAAAAAAAAEDGEDDAAAPGVLPVAESVGDDETERAAPPPPAVVPDSLSPAAARYYRRVIARGEGIDWEEEREAQRALGIQDDDDGAGNAGMGMRML